MTPNFLQKFKHKPLISIIFLSTLLNVTLVNAESDFDPKSAAEKVSKSIRKYEEDAKQLTSAEIYNSIQSEIELRSMTSKNSGLDLSIVNNENYQRTVGYALALEKRREANDPTGSFYYGLDKLADCRMYNSLKGDEYKSFTQKCFNTAFESFKVAAAHDIAAAQFNLGIMYMEGQGVNESKYAASDWFTKAATQYNKQGDRDRALTALEKALNLVPDNPKALRLRKKLLE